MIHKNHHHAPNSASDPRRLTLQGLNINEASFHHTSPSLRAPPLPPLRGDFSQPFDQTTKKNVFRTRVWLSRYDAVLVFFFVHREAARSTSPARLGRGRRSSVHNQAGAGTHARRHRRHPQTAAPVMPMRGHGKPVVGHVGDAHPAVGTPWRQLVGVRVVRVRAGGRAGRAVAQVAVVLLKLAGAVHGVLVEAHSTRVGVTAGQ